MARPLVLPFREIGGNDMTDYPVNMDIKPDVQAFFDEATNTLS